MSRGTWLGFFFFITLVILGFGTLLIGDIHFGKQTYLTVHFNMVQGLREGDDVRVEGVRMGKVDSLELNPQNGVIVTLRMDEPVVLYQDAEIVIESTSVLGGYYVSIRRGTRGSLLDLSQPLAGRVQPGFEVIGEFASENRENFRELIANLKDVTQALKDGRGSIGQAIQTPKLHDEAVATLKEAREAIAEVKKVGERLNTDRIDSTLANVEKASENLAKITEKVDKGEGTLGKLVNDKEMGDSLKRTVENIEKSSESIKNVTGKIERGEGTLGKLAQDEELYETAKRTIEDVDKVFGKAARAVVEIVGESKVYDESEMVVSKIGLRVTPSEDKYFYAGAAFMGLNKKGDILFKNLVEDDDNGTEVKGEVLLAYHIPWFLDRRITVRGGLIEGKPGGGVDVRWEDWGLFKHPVQFTFEGRDAYNDLDHEDIDERLSGPLMRAYFKAPIWTAKEEWYDILLSTLRVYGGVSRIGDDAEGMIGIGVEWPDEDIKTLVGLIGTAR